MLGREGVVLMENFQQGFGPEILANVGARPSRVGLVGPEVGLSMTSHCRLMLEEMI